MSLHPHIVEPVPEDTARVAHAAFPKGHQYLTFRDALGTIFQDEDFAQFMAVYLPTADKYRRLTRRLSQEQKGLEERALMASQQPSKPSPSKVLMFFGNVVPP